ncbi:membrane-associated protein, putative [Bodo saltans]|uniref:Membrane-associated protein, putative n=1 Tax=Bodo saltans TaxID=75058 RepID=A0A0S4JXW4_BODSA|nr:membrane-associated protein, putative [Bodo saltans]|eukprot:CUG93980.1 membrane-associated protein, putative [Bodo saltans]
MSAPTPLTCLAIGLMTSALSRTTLTTVDAIAITAVNTSATTPVNLMVLAPAFTPSVPAVVSTSDSSTSKTIISIQAASVPRSLFLARTTPVAFAMNLTLRIPGAHIPTRWGMMGATLEEQVAGGVVLTWSSLHGVIDADDDDNRGGLWYAMVVMPPVGGWLGAGTPVMTDRTLTLTFDVDCDGEALLAVVVTVQAPGSLPSLAGEVKAAVGYSQIVSVIAGGASSGSSLGRVMATRSMVMCDADAAVGGGVVDLGLKLCDDEDGGNIHTGNVAARSAIVSNVVVIGIVSCLLIILSVVWSAVMPAASACSHRFLSATAVFVLPSSLLPVFTAVLPSTSAATTLLMGRLRSSSSCMSIDVVLIVLGILVSLTPSIALTALWAIKARGPFAPWTCTKTLLSSSSKAPPRSNLEQQTTPYHRWRRATVFLLLRQWRWSTTPSLSKSCAAATASSSLSSPPSNTTTTSSGMEPAWVVLLEHRLLWYAALDATFLVAVSVLAVVGGLDTKNTALCRGVTSVVIALLALQLLAVVIVRPHTTMFSFVQSSTTLFLTCASAVSQLAFIMTSATSTSGLWLAEMSAGCNLAVVGVTAVQMLLDFAALFAATRRRMDKLCFRQRDDDTDAPALYLSTTADDHERTSDDNFVNFVDNTFFNEISGDSGNAAMAEVIENNSITSASSRSKRGGNGGGVVELMLRSSSFLPHLLAEEEEEERELSSTSFASSSRGGGRRAASSPTTSTGGGVGSSSDRAGFGSTSFDSTSFLRRAEQKFWDAGGTAKPSEESALQPILFVSHVARVDSFDENSGDDDL